MSSVPLAIKTEEVILENAEYNSAEELDEELQLQLEDSGGENTYHIEYTTEPAHQVTTSSQRRQSNMSASNTTKDGGGGGGGGDGGSSPSGKPILDTEKRMRREIANSNERRRMQSINAGFQNLRSLLPRHEGEKLSKAAILQQTFQYIVELENQKTQLLTQNSELKRQVGEHEANGGGASGGASGDNYSNSNANETSGGGGGGASAVAIKKRKLTDNVINMQTISDSSDEGLGSMSPEPMTLLSAGAGGGAAAAAAAAAAGAKLNNASIIAAKELLEMKKQLEKERSLRRLLEDELQMIKRQLYSVATAPPGTAVAAAAANSSGSGSGSSSAYIPREVIEHTDNFVRAEELEELGGTVSYVEIDEMTGQQQVVVCSSIEELESDAAAEIISEDQVHEEVILSSNSSTESENEVNVNAIAKAYAEGMSTPILQAAIKATPKVEVERINEKIVKVKTEKLDQPTTTTTVMGATAVFTRSRQNLETIVEAIRHLEGDHLFADGDQQHKLQQHYQQQPAQSQHHPQSQHHRLAQDAPLALTTGKQHAALAELRPFLQLKGNKQVIITAKSAKDVGGTVSSVTPTAIFKVQTSSSATAAGVGGAGGASHHQPVTITTSLKQCRPGVIVAKQLPSS
ncbi:longitudinals lacking protein, isoforms F/I/K/T [Drosophila novamexicana]|uniref:longitudinals lacking protein, isoforms F/I/K/T n=1 Tax=Drosophila novamexicana TaxID=47314 RepID=UPI0011E5E245|nr:longitudinals lacking protein, isoforms F/I/K/T [Drosophila novamexicana]